MLDRLIKTEDRTLENLNATVFADYFLLIISRGDFSSDAGVTVNVDNAPFFPAVWSGRLLKEILVTSAKFTLTAERRTPLEEPSKGVIRIEPW